MAYHDKYLCYKFKTHRGLLTHPQAPCQTQDEPKYVKQRNCLKLGACSQLLALEGVEGRVETPGLDQEEEQVIHLLKPASNQPTRWLVHILKHLWCQDKPRATVNSLYSPWLGLEGSHHLPPYSIFCAIPRGPHPNGFLSRDSQVGVPKLSQNCPGLDSSDFSRS